MTIRAVAAYIAGPLALAVLTAVVTLLLLLLLSLVLGGESRERAEQSRCYSALTNTMLHDILADLDIRDPYPHVNVADVDCSFLVEPVTP
jgi:hypothetical protein